tara:strand:- start:860 stop:1195 length:336 start_codon:yes stop_codon:yes gene_type:complete
MSERKDALQELLAKVEAGGRLPMVGRANHTGLNYIQVMKAHDGSLDAAKALHEAVLEGFSWSVSKHDRAYISRHTDPDDTRTWIEVSAQSDNPARAWLIAIIKALIAQEGE